MGEKHIQYGGRKIRMTTNIMLEIIQIKRNEAKSVKNWEKNTIYLEFSTQ